MKHVQFRSQVKLNYLIKVEVYLLFEFPVGRVRGYRKFLNYEFLAQSKKLRFYLTLSTSATRKRKKRDKRKDSTCNNLICCRDRTSLINVGDKMRNVAIQLVQQLLFLPGLPCLFTFELQVNYRLDWDMSFELLLYLPEL